MEENQCHCTINIIITENEKIQCSVIDGNDQIIPIQMKENQIEYDCSLTFNKNEIEINANKSEEKKTIRFMKEMIDSIIME